MRYLCWETRLAYSDRPITMASTVNAFDLLSQAGQMPSSKNKKKKNKPKPKPADEPAVEPAEQVAAESEVSAEATAIPILEKSARTFKTGGDRIKLWKDWIRQVSNGPAGGLGRKPTCHQSTIFTVLRLQATDRSPKALKYRASDGSLIQFKEVSMQQSAAVNADGAATATLCASLPPRLAACSPVLLFLPFLQLMLRSRALEITVESCITSPLTPEQTNNLQQLLSTFIPRVDPAALASSIGRLSELLAEDTQSFDTTGAAQRAVHNVIGTLKVARDEAEPVKQVSLQDRLAGVKQSDANTSIFSPVSVSVTSKHTDVSATIRVCLQPSLPATTMLLSSPVWQPQLDPSDPHLPCSSMTSQQLLQVS